MYRTPFLGAALIIWGCQPHINLWRLVSLQQSLDRLHPATSLGPFPFPDHQFHSERQTLISIKSWEHQVLAVNKVVYFFGRFLSIPKFWCLVAKKASCYLCWIFSKIAMIFVWKLKAPVNISTVSFSFGMGNRWTGIIFKAISKISLEPESPWFLWRALIANPRVRNGLCLRLPSQHVHTAMFAHGVWSSTTWFVKLLVVTLGTYRFY